MQLNVAEEMTRLESLSIGGLKPEYERLYGMPCRSNNKRWLIRKILWRLQANAEGDLSERARRRAEELANDADVRATPPRDFGAPSAATGALKTRSQVSIHTDPRIPSVGTSITREYKGRTIEVRVVKDGFEYDGAKYKSLTAVAKKISGSHCNGFRFFNLEAK
jgi:hypothetical protein